MNRYLNKLIMYHEIHRLNRQGFSISYIADFLGINWRSVKKHLAYDEREFETNISHVTRSKDLSAYEHFVKQKLDQHPCTSAAQIHDWLKEHDKNFPFVNPKTVYNFVMWVRQEYNIPKVKHEREYFIVEELPFGKQAQVDFGEYNMRRSTGGVKKIYFFTIVLSRSRYKYIYFSDTPFTSTLAVRAHEMAFEFFQGIPQEVVYDQDKVFIHDENAGDLLLTEVFKQYVRQQKFATYFCRKSDPETKGKVENVVKYVKQNFLYNRSYFDIETLNDEAQAWLHRTANYLPHGTTKLPPVEQWKIEKEYLNTFIPLPLDFDDSQLYTLRKDNVVIYKSNRYTVPEGTWTGKGTQVLVQERNGLLTIKGISGKELSNVQVSKEKGKTIVNNDHKRDKSAKIDQLIINVAGLFESPEMAVSYFALLRKEKPRYIRDQIAIIKQCFERFLPKAVNDALTFCMDNQIYSASDFKSVAFKNNQNKKATVHRIPIEIKPMSGTSLEALNIKPNTSELIDYESLLSNKN
jgi:IS30 family transposase